MTDPQCGFECAGLVRGLVECDAKVPLPDRVRFMARRLVVQRIGLRGGPSTMALSSSAVERLKRNPGLFLRAIGMSKWIDRPPRSGAHASRTLPAGALRHWRMSVLPSAYGSANAGVATTNTRGELMKSLLVTGLLALTVIASTALFSADAPATGPGVRVFVHHEVDDYAAWRKVYNSFGGTRRKLGVTAQAVYQSVDNPNDVVVTHDFATAEQAKAFISSDALKSAMQTAGVKGTPQITVTTRATK